MGLLDALLGIVSIQQNDIIKIFSIAAVVFMPPTLVASIYGMNFHHNMIELDWEFGYPRWCWWRCCRCCSSSGRCGCDSLILGSRTL